MNNRDTHRVRVLLGWRMLVVPLTLALAAAFPAASSGLLPVSKEIYWAAYNTGETGTGKIQTSGNSDLVTGLTAPFGIALDLNSDKVYWTEYGTTSGTGKIRRANLNGTGTEALLTLNSPRGIALDVVGGKMYFLAGITGSEKIQRADLNGSNVEDLVTGLTQDSRDIELDLSNGKMYWTEGSFSNSVKRANLNGSSPESLVYGGAGCCFGITLDVAAGKMYWAGNGKIQRANLNGSTVEDLITGLTGPTGVELDLYAGKIYWAEGSKIRRANTNGTGVEDVVTGAANPYLIALDPDLAAPTITITTPPEGGIYALGQVVLADYACEDEVGGSGLASCVGDVPDGNAIDTASVGPKTFTVGAADNAGNPASATHNYSVVYNFNGFFPPVDNLPTLNAVKAGSAIPVKFSLGGFQGLDIFAPLYPKSQMITCSSTAPVDGIEETVTAGSSSLSYDATLDQYIYVWKTQKSWAGTCRQLVVKLTDGTYHRANFLLR